MASDARPNLGAYPVPQVFADLGKSLRNVLPPTSSPDVALGLLDDLSDETRVLDRANLRLARRLGRVVEPATPDEVLKCRLGRDLRGLYVGVRSSDEDVDALVRRPQVDPTLCILVLGQQGEIEPPTDLIES
jgi:hypothetical protein